MQLLFVRCIYINCSKFSFDKENVNQSQRGKTKILYRGVKKNIILAISPLFLGDPLTNEEI
jgi:hypothetical protein